MNTPTTTTIYRSPEGQRVVLAYYDRVLANWPVPYEGRTVETRLGSTFAIASGEPSAPALLLLHGANSNAVSWIGDVAEYSRHFRVYAVDVPGEPGRSAQSRAPWAGPAYAEWLEDVLDGLQIERAALLGLSQGGWIALRFATAHPERVGKLVLLAPAGVTPDRASFLLRAIPLSMLGRRGAEAVNRLVFGDTPVAPEAIEFMNDIMTHIRPRLDAAPLFTDEELQRLTMPVLLIAGARDAIRPAERIAARLGGLLPRLEARILPDAGHVLHSLAPQVVPFLK